MEIETVEDIFRRMFRDNIRINVQVTPSSYDHELRVDIEMLDQHGAVYARHTEFADIPGPREDY